MAASVVYSTFGGRVVAEQRGGAIRQYVPDNLGSTIALIDDSGNVTDTYDYWPYGEERVHNGTSTTPLTYLGTLGYFKDFLNMLYVRARHLRVDLTRWMTADPLWPSQPAYAYGAAAPDLYYDPSGYNPACIACAACVGLAAVAALLACLGDSRGFLGCVGCYCAQNPAVCSALVAVCSVACALCIGALWGALLTYLRGLATVGGTLGLAGGAAASGAGSKGCGGDGDDTCTEWLEACQASCSTFSEIYGGGWASCCNNWCSQNYQFCEGRRGPYAWNCYPDENPLCPPKTDPVLTPQPISIYF